jgi:hypothetical protein
MSDNAFLAIVGRHGLSANGGTKLPQDNAVAYPQLAKGDIGPLPRLAFTFDGPYVSAMCGRVIQSSGG